jgi:hypothetical protein
MKTYMQVPCSSYALKRMSVFHSFLSAVFGCGLETFQGQDVPKSKQLDTVAAFILQHQFQLLEKHGCPS